MVVVAVCVLCHILINAALPLHTQVHVCMFPLHGGYECFLLHGGTCDISNGCALVS